MAAGCGVGAVTVESYQPEPDTTSVCESLVQDLPKTIGEAIRRDLDPPIETAAAWGSPPIVLRCGVPAPAEYRPDAELFEVNGVSWLPVEGKGGIFFTTIGRAANVEVAVPDRYAPEAQVLTDLAPVISDHVPVNAGQGVGATPS